MKAPVFQANRESALTLLEVFVALVIIGVLVAMALPAIAAGSCNRMPTQALSNMRQLHDATRAMAADGDVVGNPNLDWPGNTGGTFTNWAAQLVPGYLTTNDFCKLVSGPGKNVKIGALPVTMNETAIRLYAVTKKDSDRTVFLSSANFTNSPAGGGPLNSKAKPFGNNCAVVFRKGGEGAVLMRSQAGQPDAVGEYAPLCR